MRWLRLLWAWLGARRRERRYQRLRRKATLWWSRVHYEEGTAALRRHNEQPKSDKAWCEMGRYGPLNEWLDMLGYDGDYWRIQSRGDATSLLYDKEHVQHEAGTRNGQRTQRPLLDCDSFPS